MKKISLWASFNIGLSRLLIIFCHLLLVVLAIIIGFLSYNLNIVLPTWMLQTTFVLFTLAGLYYPVKNAYGKWSKNYYFRKSLDFVLVFMGFAMTTIGFNQFCHEPVFLKTEAKEINIPRAEFMVNASSGITKGNAKVGLFPKFKKAKREFKKNLKAKIKAARKAIRTNQPKTISVGMQIFLIIVSIFVAFLALFAVALIGCSVACSGAEGLGTAIIILGLLGIGVGLFFVIRSIIRKGEKYQSKKGNNLDTASASL